jgi:hypothetical protein
MKKQLLYLLLGIVATSFTACSDNSYTSRLKELIIEDMTFTSGQSSKTVSFRHEDLSNYECKSSEEWCEAAFDVAGSKLTVSVKANETYDPRTATITLADRLNNATRTFTATQDQANSIILDESSFEVPMEGGNVEVKLKSNVKYEVVIPSDCDWISLAPEAAKSRALEESTFTLVAKENKSYKERTAIITVTSKDTGISDKIKVSQPFNTVFNADNKSFEVAMEGGTVTINMESNINYDVTIPSDCDWITRTTSAKNSDATRATSTSAILLSVKENTSYKNREAIITIGNEEAQKAGAIKEPVKIHIKQAFTTTLKVDNQALEVDTEGKTVTVNVESNVPYEVNIPCDWITQVSGSKTRAAKTSVLTFRVDANSSGEDRTATITINSTKGDEEASVTITQKFSVAFSVDESPITIDELGGTRSITVAANVDIEVLPQDDWLTVGEKKAGGKGYWTQVINVAAFKNKVAQREGTVKFLYAPTNKAFNIKITQKRLLYITEQEISLNEGDESKPVTLNNPNGMEVSWSSSNTSVATVNGTGNVTAGEAGTAEITVSSADKKYSDKVKVTVNKKAEAKEEETETKEEEE